MKQLFLTIFLSSVIYAQSPFLLTKLQSVYPLVEVNTKKVSKDMVQKILPMLQKAVDDMKIKRDGYSPRPLGIMISHVPVEKALVLKIELILAEEVKRLDDDEEVFAITYQHSDIFEVEDMDFLEDDVMGSVDFLIEMFKDQYKEDNQ